MKRRSKPGPAQPAPGQFHAAVTQWFVSAFGEPTRAQELGWPVIARGDSTLLLAPTGSGKTLAAFLWCIDRLGFGEHAPGCRVVYVSPLKALAVDVERNLREPILGIEKVAQSGGDAFTPPGISIRTGDTPARARARFQRRPTEILITTPESLYLLLTSAARDALRTVETVIVDEIHALVSTKRGSHLALSLERLEALTVRSPQRIGLSATQRPLEEVACFLGGAKPRGGDGGESELFDRRPVTIVDAGQRKRLEIRVEVPVEDMAKLHAAEISSDGNRVAAGESIWPAIHPRLLELIRAHRSTLIFVNNRRLAERLAAAINELAGETIVQAHHGSLAHEQRAEIEEALKNGCLPALTATSSLELGIDMGAIDLVIQIEAPPSVASGMQRIGRASHQVGAVSRGVVIPKYRGDLLACAAVSEAMLDGRIEASRYPRNPLDVLAQQIVAMVAVEPWNVSELFETIRCAAPFATLGRTMFDGVLDLLSGVYPSEEFSGLRPRIHWDRLGGTVRARPGARQVAITNGGTIPDRGLYGVFLAGLEGPASRVGELDEEMVFESREGETFLLGASTWRIEQITHDRVLVSAAPGQPGKMPFWKGDGAGRSVELGREIGRLVREIRHASREDATARLVERHGLDERAAKNTIDYLRDQEEAVGVVPDDRTIVVERNRDELGDWRVCVLSPLGGRLHAPWAMAATEMVRRELGIDVEAMWGDDGFILRFPETDDPPSPALLIPAPDALRELVVQRLGASALFAGKFRESAARALLLPRRRPGERTPLWKQRKRSWNLLQVAAAYPSFPILLEAYRESLVDLFDMPALGEVLEAVRAREIRVETIDTDRPSPFARSLLFRYVANYLYDGDAPLAERRAQALTVDQAQLRELVGDVELRELLDAVVIGEVERELQHLEGREVLHADGLHDLLRRLGDLDREECAARAGSRTATFIAELVSERRAVEIRLAGGARLIAAEDAARYRDALQVAIPEGLPARFLVPVDRPLDDLVLRWARSHGPFSAAEVADRFAIDTDYVVESLVRLEARRRVIEGEFRPGGRGREWCDDEVLGRLRRRSLAKLRRETEPVELAVFSRFLSGWQGVAEPRRGLDALLDTVENLQGLALPASILESEILPARLADYRPDLLDTLAAEGEIVWVGIEPLGEHDGRVALYLTEQAARLRGVVDSGELDEVERRIVEYLRQSGAAFFGSLHQGIGGGFENETVDAVWRLVWRGVVTNDSFHPLRSYLRSGRARSRVSARRFRSRRAAPVAAQGRWSLVVNAAANETERASALVRQMLDRWGIVTRETAAVESVRGGFAAIAPVLRALEEAGRIRRGYFVSAIAAQQFALPGAIERLRRASRVPEVAAVVVVAAADPANPWGALVRWPSKHDGLSPSRAIGARVVLVDGHLSAWIVRGGRRLVTWLPEEEPDRSRIAGGIAEGLATVMDLENAKALLVTEIDGVPAESHPICGSLRARGFRTTSRGLQLRLADRT